MIVVSVYFAAVIFLKLEMLTVKLMNFSLFAHSVMITEQKIEIFDTGPGMDGSHENSLVQWYNEFLLILAQ